MNIKVLLGMLMIGHSMRLGQLHIRKLPLKILTSELGIKSQRHNILSCAINIMTVYHNKFINAHHKILQLNILKTWLDILLF